MQVFQYFLNNFTYASKVDFICPKCCKMLSKKKIKIKVRELVLPYKTLITSYVLIQSLQKFICKYFNTSRTTLLKHQRTISFVQSVEITSSNIMRKKIKNKVRELILFQKILITPYVLIQSLQKFICKYFDTYRTTLLKHQRSISFVQSIKITL